MDKKRLLRFNEPHTFTGGEAVVTLSVQQAINAVRKYRNDILDDEDALKYFMTIYWAWYIDTETVKD